MSKPASARGPWNEGEMPGMGKDFEYVDDPLDYVKEKSLEKTSKEMKDKLNTQTMNEKLSKEKSAEVKKADAEHDGHWDIDSPQKK